MMAEQTCWVGTTLPAQIYSLDMMNGNNSSENMKLQV